MMRFSDFKKMFAVPAFKKEVFSKSKYLLDPHTAVAVKSIDYLRNQLDDNSKILCICS